MATDLKQIQTRGDTAVAWTAANPVLLAREMGIETDTGKFKFGDGVTAWNSLAYNFVAGRATVLATARTIGGKSFDGSANIVPAGLILQIVPYTEAADKSTSSSIYADLVNQSITLIAGSTLEVDWDGSWLGPYVAANYSFKLIVDGVTRGENVGTYNDTNSSGYVRLRAVVTGLAAGARVVQIQWKSINNSSLATMYCSSVPTKHYSRLVLREISG